jgi:malic enzyme
VYAKDAAFCWPYVLLQFEGFAQNNALTLLQRCQNDLSSFNDDF